MKKNRKRLVIWMCFVLYILFGFLPYKFPEHYTGKNELLVYSPEWTCASDLYIKKGKLQIPNQYKNTLHSHSEITIEDDHPLKKLEWDLLKGGGNEFIIVGTVIGVDSSDVKWGCDKRPIVKIESWSPTRYHLLLCTLDFGWVISYIGIGIILIIVSIVSFIRSRKKSVTNNG